VSNGSEVTAGESLNRKLHQLFVALILIWVVLAGFRPMMDNVDLGWHVAQGRWIVQHFSFYRYDLLNYPNLGHPIIHEYPFFQIILYLFWCLGWWGPCLLTAAAYAILVWVLIRAASQFDLGASCLPPLAIGLMLLCFQVAFPLRPHLATYFGVILLGIFLLRHRNETSWTTFWPMALLQVAWTNSHSGFVLGPAMVALFGAELTVRNTLRDRSIPWATLRTWVPAFLLILLACFVNPHGWARFGPPFYQDSLESIRAYVGEMEPLNGFLASFYGDLSLFSLFIILGAILFRRGAVAFTFLIFAFFFYHQALEVKKAWPVFGLFIPLIVLSTGAFSSSFALRKPLRWLSVAGHAVISVIVAACIGMELSPSLPTSLSSMWQQYDQGRTELSLDATAWMKANHIEGRLFHRCEDGGMLQMEGYDHAETFADTGFGKYDEAFIHEIGVVNERPAAIPLYLNAYHPDFVVCSTFCYRWPYYLRSAGWQPIFYSPNSSVWALTGTRPDLVPVKDNEIEAIFDHDIEVNGRPLDSRLFGRNLIALNSFGLENFAFEKLTSLPKDLHHTPWYWEAARFMCFSEPPFSAAHRRQLFDEATQLHDDVLTAEFRAYFHSAFGRDDDALCILESIPSAQLSNFTAELLLKIYVARHDPRALPLARRTDCFDIRNGHHWQLLAQAEEQAGHTDAADRAWQKAVFYYPDDPTLLSAAAAFAEKNHDASLSEAINATSTVYGQR
jgi:tetratricopeptide (TPR) repeat protein